ncbi:hypothetical protein V2W45_358046 [Cenococcum geophilum]
MMILPFYSLTASIMLGCFAAAFARGPVDGQGVGSEVSKITRMNLERRENGLSAGADIVVSFQLSVAECTQHLCQVLSSPHHTNRTSSKTHLRRPMMILPFYSLTASIVLSSFAAAFARGPVDGRGDSSEAKSEGKSHREHLAGSLATH